MVGIGEPKEVQGSNAGLLVMTWYTRLGGVSTLGFSAIGRSTALNQSALTVTPLSHALAKMYNQLLYTFPAKQIYFNSLTHQER